MIPKPCPFCGGEVKKIIGFNPQQILHKPECWMRDIEWVIDIDKWNTRHDPEKLSIDKATDL